MKSFVLCDFFKIRFHWSRPPPNFTRNETFCERKGLNVFGTVRLTGNLHKKNSIFFPQFSVFFSRFSIEKDGFFDGFSWEEWFSSLVRIPSGIFWRFKNDEILTMSFYPLFAVWFCLICFFFKRLQVFAKHGFASVFEAWCENGGVKSAKVSK